MPVFRKFAVCSVLASYLFANTIASSLHDHRDCCSHSEAVQHRTANCSQPGVHRESGKHCCHHRHDHGHKQAPVTCQNQRPSRHPASHPASHPSRQEQDSGSLHQSQHCVVCDFLALAPLPAPQIALETAAEELPEIVVLDVLPVSSTAIETHLARGPPAA